MTLFEGFCRSAFLNSWCVIASSATCLLFLYIHHHLSFSFQSVDSVLPTTFRFEVPAWNRPSITCAPTQSN